MELASRPCIVEQPQAAPCDGIFAAACVAVDARRLPHVVWGLATRCVTAMFSALRGQGPRTCFGECAPGLAPRAGDAEAGSGGARGCCGPFGVRPRPWRGALPVSQGVWAAAAGPSGSPSLGSGRGGSRSGEQSSRQGTPTPDALFLGHPPSPLVGRGPGQLSVDRLRASVLEEPARGCTLASGWAEAVLTYIS